MNTLQISFAVFLIFQTIVSYGGANSVKEVSHEDIRDAILSLVHMFRDNTDKLERHENRERQLGDQLKKAFGVIEKKQKNEETNTNSMLDILTNINNRLQNLENNIVTAAKDDSNKSKISKLETLIENKITGLEQEVQANRLILEQIKENFDGKLQSVMQNVETLQSNVVLIDQKLNLGSVTASNKTEVSKELQSKLSEEILRLQEQISQQTSYLSDKLSEGIQQTVKLQDLKELENATIDSLSSIKVEFMEFSKTQNAELQNIINKSYQILNQDQDNRSTLTVNSITAIDTLNANVQKSYDQILKEMKGLSKIEQVLIQTADNVLDAKRRIEYGTHQILLEVGDIIKTQTKELNQSIGERFDGISFDIVNGQNGALTNLSLKIETEISQVWRQIGIMYQTLTNSADTLDKLQQHTEIYVNGSLSTLDNMEGKVSQITGRMTEVDDNLNYLLGRLSLVTQEFNQIKTGLGDALDTIRSNFHTVQSKVKDVGPGPNPIEEDGAAYSQLQKTAYSIS